MGNQSYGGEGGDSWVTSHLNHIFTGKKDARVFLSDNKLIRRELACVVQNGNVTSGQLFPRALGVRTAMFFLCLLTFHSLNLSLILYTAKGNPVTPSLSKILSKIHPQTISCIT